MKNIIISFALMFISIQLHAQLPAQGMAKVPNQNRFGLRAGFNFASMTISPTIIPASMIFGYHFGGIAEFGINETFALESGLIITGKGFKQELTIPLPNGFATARLTLTPIYAEVPMNIQYKISMDGRDIHILLGPYFAMGFLGTKKLEVSASGMQGISESLSLQYGDGLSSDLSVFDAGINFGLGIEMRGVQIRGQYSFGLSSVIPDAYGQSETAKHKVASVSLGYIFSKAGGKEVKRLQRK